MNGYAYSMTMSAAILSIDALPVLVPPARPSRLIAAQKVLFTKGLDMAPQDGGGKLPGKTEYSGRRRTVTRRSGFKVTADATGGEYRLMRVPAYAIQPGQPGTLVFRWTPSEKGAFIGYGGWFATSGEVKVSIVGGPVQRTLSAYSPPCWNKFGSMWRATTTDSQKVEVVFEAAEPILLALYQPHCGTITHKHLASARPELLPNMYQFSPEAHVEVASPGSCELQVNGQHRDPAAPSCIDIHLKSCNRCARFLPINTENERCHLSFSNHCVAPHRRPCRHGGFGRLTHVDTGQELQLDYGFQLECRFCKKFEVNAAHNPKRTAAQMKEDAARRRGFELLIEALYQGTPQLRYREQTGRELAEDIYHRFAGKCFNCDAELATVKDMHLDHTRPLALLWPLGGTATALCGNCNSQKRDRAPADFYTENKLLQLSQIVGLPPEELADPSPNMQAVELLLNRLDWFFDTFLMTEDMVKERQGKIAGELLVKALQKVLERCPDGAPVDLLQLYNKRRRR